MTLKRSLSKTKSDRENSPRYRTPKKPRRQPISSQHTPQKRYALRALGDSSINERMTHEEKKEKDGSDEDLMDPEISRSDCDRASQETRQRIEMAVNSQPPKTIPLELYNPLVEDIGVMRQICTSCPEAREHLAILEKFPDDRDLARKIAKRLLPDVAELLYSGIKTDEELKAKLEILWNPTDADAYPHYTYACAQTEWTSQAGRVFDRSLGISLPLCRTWSDKKVENMAIHWQRGKSLWRHEDSRPAAQQ